MDNKKTADNGKGDAPRNNFSEAYRSRSQFELIYLFLLKKTPNKYRRKLQMLSNVRTTYGRLVLRNSTD